jgi:hypothetical protein
MTAKQKSRQRLAAENMTPAQKIRRDLTGGRPPAGELKTPTGAVTAARILHRELETRMSAEGLKPKTGDWCVSIGYVSADLSVLGFSPLFAPGEEAELMKYLSGHVMLGLIFGMVDKEAKESKDEIDRIVTGTRPFFVTTQTEDWLDELVTPVSLELLG